MGAGAGLYGFTVCHSRCWCVTLIGYDRIGYASNNYATLIFDFELARDWLVGQSHSALSRKAGFFQRAIERWKLKAVDIDLVLSVLSPMIEEKAWHDGLRVEQENLMTRILFHMFKQSTPE